MWIPKGKWAGRSEESILAMDPYRGGNLTVRQKRNLHEVMNTLKSILLRLRNRFHPGNSVRLGRGSVFHNEGNTTGLFIRGGDDNRIHIATGARLRGLIIDIKGSGNEVRIGADVFLSGQIDILGTGNLVEIGSGTRINHAFLLAHNGHRITIGEQCLFSTGIDIRTTDSHRIMDASGNRINEDADVHIEPHCWLGMDVLVLKGSRIAEGCVVGARSTVSGDIPPRSLCAGTPARVLRQEISWKA